MPDSVTLLAVDTALGACSAALLHNDDVRACRFVPMARGHAEALAPMVEEVMGEAGLAFADLDRLAVTVGPGTFTGQRVGLAFARGLRVALGKPLTGVTSLAAMAAQAMAETGADRTAVLHDARRGEVYIEVAAREGEALLAPSVMPFEDALLEIRRLPGGRIALAGTAASRAVEILEREGVAFALSAVTAPDAVWVGRLAARLPPSETPPVPLYLRAPDAKLPGAS